VGGAGGPGRALDNQPVASHDWSIDLGNFYSCPIRKHVSSWQYVREPHPYEHVERVAH